MFQNRARAGKALAEALVEAIGTDPDYADPVVLALPRGGVPVAAEIARALDAPLDLVLVRKLGVPFQPELAAGAVVDGRTPETVLNREIMDMAGISEADLDPAKAEALEEIERRRDRYLRGRAPVPVAGRAAILVDDGIATGATARAALQALRRRRPKALVLAVPVAPADTLERLRGAVDRVVCLDSPEPFHAIGLYYADFHQVDDGEVVGTLDACAAQAPPQRY